MRTVVITVHNNQRLEVFVEKLKHGFEIWLVGPVKGRRVILDHHLTHDDLEARLEYAEAGDLVWRDAAHSEIPAEKHQNAVEMEETIKRGTFVDFEVLHQSVSGHFGGIGFLEGDRKESNTAKKALLGRWTDGVVTLTMEPNNKLKWSCTDRQHPLNVGEQVHKHAPDWWNFARWRLALMNDEHKCGTHIGVLRADEQELHLCGSHLHRIAQVFHRDKSVGHHLEEAATSNEHLPQPRTQGKRSPAAGKASPLLRQLEQAITRRNPLLAERLKAGLPESDIRAALSKAKVVGAIEPVVQLYSWRNGMALDEQTPMGETSFFPVDIYQFIDLESAVNQLKTMDDAAKQLRGMLEGTKAHSMFSGITGSLFPLFTDGATGTIAVDLTPAKRNRVVTVEFESTEPVHQAYGSFEEFLNDVIRANREDSSLACFSHEKSG